MLAGFRVLDATSGDAAFCGRLLADLGADVIHVEPPEGERGRRLPPFASNGDRAGQPVSLYWNFLNLNKRGVTLDLNDDQGRSLFKQLASNVDVLIESFPPGTLRARGLGYEQLASDSPQLVVTSITPFGQDGPYAGIPATDLISLAMAGYLGMSGYPDRPPNRISVDQAMLLGAAEASTATVMALLARERLGSGQHIDVAVHDVLVQLFGRASLAKWQTEQKNFERQGDQAMAALGLSARRSVFKCADGYINFQVLGGVNSHFVQNLADWMTECGWDSGVTKIDWVAYEYGVLDSEGLIAAEEEFEQFFQTKTSAELLRESLKRRLMIFPMSRPSEILALEPLVELDQMAPQRLEGEGADEHGGTIAPTRYFSSSLLDWSEGRRAPSLGEHNDEIFGGELGMSGAELAAAGNAGPDAWAAGPLAGIRVTDFSWVIAGPAVSRYLSKCGAEVIRIESSKRLDPLRITPPFLGERSLDTSLAFSSQNGGKKSVALDLSTDEGRELALKLVAESDVVIENYTGGTLERMGLSYERMRELKPDIVLLSLGMFGQTGSWRSTPGYGMGLASLMGFADLNGWPDRPPLVPGAYTDQTVPPIAATVLVAALLHRNRTGSGQWIDFSQSAAASLLLAAPLLEAAANGNDWSRIGNRSRSDAPHGVYPTTETDVWCAIAVEDESQWAALKAAMGQPSWADEDRFDRMDGRLAEQDDLDNLVAGWTAPLTVGEIVATLREAGVPAAPLQTAAEIAEDPQLRHRGFLTSADHPVMGEMLDCATGFRFSRSVANSDPSPMMGEHTGQVLSEVLGMPDEEIAALVHKGITE